MRQRIFAIAVLLLISPALCLAEPFGNLAVVFPLTASKLSSTFGMRKHPILHFVRHHSGVDLAAPKNSLVRSMLAGRIVYAGEMGGFGNLITIQHPNGYCSMYGHLNQILVTVGEEVTAGQLIGRVGATGLSTGPHLHFEWRKDGKALNPLETFPELVARAQG